MPALLLPDTAAPFAPRSSPTVVLPTKVDPWLTSTLKRVNRIKRSLNSVPQHLKCLTDTLSLPSAIWHLCTIMTPKAPSSQLANHSNPLTESLTTYTPLHITAYVVHVDLVLSHEVAFKLSKDTIEDLVEYHKDIYLHDQREQTWPWTEKEAAVKKLHENFVQQVNKFIYRTNANALEGLEDDGAGELLEGRAEEVKQQVLALFCPLLPPPPRVVDVVRPPAQMLPSNATGSWWSPSPVPSNAAPSPVEPWKILPSSPVEDNHHQQHSPPVSSSQPHYSHSRQDYTHQNNNSNNWMSSMMDLPSVTYSQQQNHTAATTMGASMAMGMGSMSAPLLPLPSMVAQQCGAGFGFGFGWDHQAGRGYADYAATM
ncbi:Similar to hypothetical protein [Tuber melanosporum Mel28]; acc. no. XP_002835271 [Pyronema omphalodes CBS 100304]|uniref:Uncharacterized protein n=1 Tax=Pyronema omphalodes (strain CBS 100304) TaxID=1076935 RepID=U4LJB5_PYROM|nr:Similar to hypothetical protein [Tuber melanosporum Mel28]; acc. no. XP_002835271 [Pyronema omphalodes CBS 100304]